MSVQTRSLLPYQKHLVNKALKFSTAFLQGGKLLVKIAFDNGDMSSPKRHVFISLLFILKCFSKPYIINSVLFLIVAAVIRAVVVQKC